MPGRTDSRSRLLLVFAALLVASTVMGARLAYWQIGQQQALAEMATLDSSYTRVVPSVRGTIWDRTGTIALARTVIKYRVIGSPHDLTPADRKRTATALVDYLSLTGDDAAKIEKAMSGSSYYILLADGVDQAVVDEMKVEQGAGGLAGISFETQPLRIYPQTGGAPGTSLAAHLLGFVNTAGKGQYGIEQQYDELLAGKPTIVRIDPTRSGPGNQVVAEQGVAGEDVKTSIDAGLQLQLEQEIFAAWIADKAKAVSGVVMDPKTGEVLAEASYPSYDANHYAAAANQNPSIFSDPVVSQQYEPGSVFKMLTASAALQTKTTALTTYINDTGVIKLAGDQEIADADRRAKGWMTFADIIAYSRNVGASTAAFRLGKNTSSASKLLYQTWQGYGIGQKTGIDVAGEALGEVRNPAQDPWAKMDLANASFGQGVAVTPIQVTRAYCAMANGGLLVRPHVVVRDGSAGTTGAGATPQATPRAVSASISTSLVGLMQHVVTTVPSYAQRTYIPGYFVGGKTGTAQIWDPTMNHGKGDWKVDIYNYSFYGWIGHSRPDLVIGTVIYEGTPTRIGQGLLDMPIQSYELFRRIATDAVTPQHIPPNPNGPRPPGTKRATPQG